MINKFHRSVLEMSLALSSYEQASPKGHSLTQPEKQKRNICSPLTSDSKTRLYSEREFFLTNSLVSVCIIWQLAKFLQCEVSTLLFTLFRAHLSLQLIKKQHCVNIVILEVMCQQCVTKEIPERNFQHIDSTHKAWSRVSQKPIRIDRRKLETKQTPSYHNIHND